MIIKTILDVYKNKVKNISLYRNQMIIRKNQRILSKNIVM